MLVHVVGIIHTVWIDEWNDVEIVVVKKVLGDIIRGVTIDELVSEILNHLSSMLAYASKRCLVALTIAVIHSLA